jgi:hypothetical protein
MVANCRAVWVYTHYMHGAFGEIFKASTHQKSSVTYIKWPHMMANVDNSCHGQMLVDCCLHHGHIVVLGSHVAG